MVGEFGVEVRPRVDVHILCAVIKAVFGLVVIWSVPGVRIEVGLFARVLAVERRCRFELDRLLFGNFFLLGEFAVDFEAVYDSPKSRQQLSLESIQFLPRSNSLEDSHSHEESELHGKWDLGRRSLLDAGVRIPSKYRLDDVELAEPNTRTRENCTNPRKVSVSSLTAGAWALTRHDRPNLSKTLVRHPVRRHEPDFQYLPRVGEQLGPFEGILAIHGHARVYAGTFQ